MIENLFKQRQIDNKQFSFYLSSINEEEDSPLSEFIIGGYDKKYMVDDSFSYAPIISDDFFAVELK